MEKTGCVSDPLFCFNFCGESHLSSIAGWIDAHDAPENGGKMLLVLEARSQRRFKN
jgi:hypothetical protein